MSSIAMPRFLWNTTFGVLFLLPVALVLLVLDHALKLAGKVIQPISHSLNFDRAVTGISVADVLAVILLVAVSFAAGIIALTNAGRRSS
jgi:uncharacterized membrane protein